MNCGGVVWYLSLSLGQKTCLSVVTLDISGDIRHRGWNKTAATPLAASECRGAGEGRQTCRIKLQNCLLEALSRLRDIPFG